MKKVLISLAMLLGLVACQNDFQSVDVDVNGEAALTLTVGLPADATRAAGVNSAEGALTNINLDEYDIRFILEVYDAAGNLAKERITNYEDDATTTVFDLRLVPGREYNFVAWADFVKEDVEGDYHYITTDGLTNVEVNAATWNAMDESRDAYTGVKNIKEFKSTSAINFELKRPFAKLRVVTTDIKELYGDLLPEDVTVKYNTKLFTAYNALSTEATVAEFPTTKVVKLSEKAYSNETPKSTGVMTLFADYMLAETEASPIQFTMDVVDNKGVAIPTIVFNTAIPIQRNYLTTITGPILTDSNNITVTINDAFDNEHNIEDEPYYVEIWDGKSTSEPKHNGTTIADATEIYIEKGSELAWLADAVNGVTRADAMTFKNKTVKLMYDVDLGNNEWTPIGTQGYTAQFSGIFDGQGHKIVNLKVNNVEAAGLFGGMCGGAVKNLTIDGVELNTNHYAGAVVAWSESGSDVVDIVNCHVKNAKITVTPEVVDGKWDNGDKAGAIVGFAHATIVDNCSAENVEVVAFRDVAALVGYAQKGSVKNSSVKNATVVADHTHDYKENGKATAGVFVGRFGNTTPEMSGNTEENVKVIVKVNSTEELANAVAAGHKDIKLGKVEGAYEIPFFEDRSISFEGIEDGVVLNQPSATHANKYYTGSEIYFKNVTIDGTQYGGGVTTYHGFVGALVETYDNCRFTDYFMFAADDVTVNDCEFICQPGQYFWTGLANEVEFNRCKFYGVERALHLCAPLAGEDRVVTLNNCEFTATELNKTAIEVDAKMGPYTLNINNTTATGFKVSETTGESLFNIKSEPEKVTIYVNGLKWSKDGYTDENGNESFQATTTEDFTAAIAEIPAGETGTISLYAGEYTFPASKLHEGITVNCAEGTVFTGSSSLNANGATIIGAAFENEGGTAATGTVNGTYKDCVFDGSNGLRWCYAGETAIFENCVFSGDVYGAHFDGGANDVIFRNCTFSGFNAFGGAITQLTLDKCTFVANGRSGYNGVNLWGSTKLIGCEFTFDGSVTEWVDVCASGNSYEVEGCTINGEPFKLNDLGIYGDCDVTYNGAYYAYASTAANLAKYVNEAKGDIEVFVTGDIAGDATLQQKPNVGVTITGNGKNYNGAIVIDGKTAGYDSASMTIKGLNFSADTLSDDAFINLGKEGNNNTRYTRNVRVEGCTFSSTGEVIVAVKSYTGGDKYVSIIDCTVNEGVHSLAQLTNVEEGLKFEGCVVAAKNGVNLNNTPTFEMNDCSFDVKGYAIRVGVNGEVNANTKNFEVANSTLKSACAESDDAVIVFRTSATKSVLTLENTTLDGTVKISGATENTTINGTY